MTTNAPHSLHILAAATVALICEAASNALFAYSFGAIFHAHVAGHRVSIDGAVLALASVSIAIFQAQSATQLVRGPRRLASACVLAVCLAYSVGAMASHLMHLDRIERQHAADQSARYRVARAAVEDAARALAPLDAELTRLAGARTLPEIDAALLQTSVPDAVRRRTDNCTSASLDTSRDLCAPVHALRTERAQAEARAAVQARRDATAAHVRALRETAAGIGDPESRTDAERLLRAWLPWIFAAAIEACATFGFVLAGARTVRPAQNAPAPRPAAPAPTAAPVRRPPAGDVWAALQRASRDASEAAAVGAALDASTGTLTFSQAGFARALGVSKSTVSNRLRELQAHGAVTVSSGQHGTTVTLAATA